MYAAYNEMGIWAFGETAEDAMEKMVEEIGLGNDVDEYDGISFRIAPMTDRLAERVEREGYDVNNPAYNWTVLAGGVLDLELEA